MFEKPKIPEGFISLADWKSTRVSQPEKQPLLLVSKPVLDKKSINQLEENTLALIPPLQSRCTELLSPTSLTRNDVLKGIAIGTIFSIPFLPIAYSLGAKGSAVIVGIISVITTAYCYNAHKHANTSDFFKLPTQPVTITPIMAISNLTKNKQESNSEKGPYSLSITA